ncbi:hypothetical protein FS842_001190 [Serendipita sp. 407]|nr:hypothetical protein FS842_001190 [Serendipita sp. 407]
MMAFEDDDASNEKSSMDLAPILLEAAKDMSQYSVLTMKGFTLHDAMMAIQVMDPRMDSGMDREEYPRRSFDPYQLFLPEEICWMMDRMFSAEMSWHTGHSLAQSVFTFLYTHEIGVGRMWNGSKVSTAILKVPQDAERPVQLNTFVLRAAVHGLLKSCDLAWREMTKGHINEMEDFNADKSERFICETISQSEIIGMLDGAKAWLLSKQASSISFRAEIIARIELRRAMLMILSSVLPAEEKNFQAAIRQAKSHLRDISSLKTPPTPDEGSPAWLTFDPAISRRLISVMPSRVVPLLDQVETWELYSLFLDGLVEVGLLGRCFSFTTVKDLLDCRAIQPPRMNRGPLLRSLACTAIQNARGDWWASELFLTLVNVDLDNVFGRNLPAAHIHQTPPGYFQISLGKMAREYLGSFFSNRPRQRRQLCNWMSEWRMLGPQLISLSTYLDQKFVVDVNRVIAAYTLIRLMAATHIVLAGLESDIHGNDELPFVLWYGANLYRTLAETMREVVESDHESDQSPVGDYLSSQISWASIMAHFCIAASMTYLVVTNPIQKRDGASTLSRREQVNLRRRFKWAFETTNSPDHTGYGHPGSQRHKQQSTRQPPPHLAEKHASNSRLKDPWLPDFVEWELFSQRVFELNTASLVRKLVAMYETLEGRLGTYGEELLQKGSSSRHNDEPGSMPTTQGVVTESNGLNDEKPPLPPRSRTMGNMLRDIFLATPVQSSVVSRKALADSKVERTVSELQVDVVNEMKATASSNLEALRRLDASTSTPPVANLQPPTETHRTGENTGTRIKSSPDNPRNLFAPLHENIAQMNAVKGFNSEGTDILVERKQYEAHSVFDGASNRDPDREGTSGDGWAADNVSGLTVASGNDYTRPLDGGRHITSNSSELRGTGGDGGVAVSRGRSGSGHRPTSAVQDDRQNPETASFSVRTNISSLVQVDIDDDIDMEVGEGSETIRGMKENEAQIEMATLRVDMEKSPSRWFPILYSVQRL